LKLFSHRLKQRPEKNPTINLPIKAIVTTQLFEEKQRKKLIKKLHWVGLSKGWNYFLVTCMMIRAE
jgi:hypothetical protein